MKKKGFTLVELLAVIAILAFPSVLKMFNDSKKNAFNDKMHSAEVNSLSEEYC